MRLITLLAFAGLFAIALSADATTGLPGENVRGDMAAMGVLTPGPLPGQAAIEQTAANSVGGQAGQDGWGSEEQLTNNSDTNYLAYSGGHKVVVTSTGVRHVVWQTSSERVYYKRYWPGSGWSKDYQLSKQGYTPSIALDSNGTTIHVVWRAWKHVGSTNFHIFYQKCNVTGPGTGGWVGSAMDLCDNASGNDHLEPSVACGRNGQVVVSWKERGGYPNWLYSIGFREYAGGAWQPQAALAGPVAGYWYCPSIATAGNGDVFVAYYGSQSLGTTDSFHVYVKSRLSGVWQSWENVTKSLGYPDSFIAPDIDVDPTNGHPHVVCHSYAIVGGVSSYHVYYTYYDGTGWTVPVMISDAAANDVTPSMFFGSDGSANVVWRHSSRNLDPGVTYIVRSPSGIWGTPSLVASGDNVFPNIAVSSTGSVYVVWEDGRNGPYQIWGRLCTPGSFGGPMAGTTVTPRGLTLGVSPNPASSRMVISYSLPAAASVSLKLYDISGALAKTVACGHVQPGSHAVSLARQGLARGAYILKLESGNCNLTRKLVIE